MTHPLSAPAPGGDDESKKKGDASGAAGGRAASGGSDRPAFGDGGADGRPSGTGKDYVATGEKTELVKLVRQLESIEIRTDRDLYRYARLARAIGMELSLRVQMDADWIQALLSQYKGRWYTFGAESRIRARLVAGHLRQGAKASEVFGLSGIKTYAAFQRHFVKPEIEAQKKQKTSKDGGFTITEADGKDGGRGRRTA